MVKILAAFRVVGKKTEIMDANIIFGLNISLTIQSEYSTFRHVSHSHMSSLSQLNLSSHLNFPPIYIYIVSNYLFNCNIGSPVVKSAKEKIEEFDEAKKKVAYSVIGGDMMQYYKTFKATLEVIPEGEGSIVKWNCEFEKASEEVPDPNLIRDLAAKNFHEIDAYLLTA